MAKIRQEYQRYDLRQVVELLSEYRVVVSPVQVIDREIEAVLDKSYGPNVPGLDPVQYIDRGWVRALGAEDYAADIEAIRAREVDRIASLAPDGVELFEEIFQGFQFFKERAILDGPNWAARRESLVPYVQVADIARIMDARLKQELSLRDAFDLNPSCRRGRIRDYVMTRSVKDDYMPIMAVQLARRGRDGLEFYETRERMRELFDSMPGCDAMVTLKTMYHRNVEHRWAINDIYDIDALSVAMPYCDIVLTDGAVANQANTSQLADRLDVVVSNQLDSLWEILD
ncbi:MAG: hypothetical protein F4X49_12745 [Acidimicrobiia bacterium]|nr:hypothetical protein [Acidimicrobiia bacterium]